MRRGALGLLVCAALVAPACRPRSAADRVLEERARWTVLALDWTQSADHTILVSTRLNGPSASALDALTIRILLLDGAGATLREVWHVYDLATVPRGGPRDFTVLIPADAPVQGLSVDTVLRPDEAQARQIRELAGLE